MWSTEYLQMHCTRHRRFLTVAGLLNAKVTRFPSHELAMKKHCCTRVTTFTFRQEGPRSGRGFSHAGAYKAGAKRETNSISTAAFSKSLHTKIGFEEMRARTLCAQGKSKQLSKTGIAPTILRQHLSGRSQLFGQKKVKKKETHKHVARQALDSSSRHWQHANITPGVVVTSPNYQTQQTSHTQCDTHKGNTSCAQCRRARLLLQWRQRILRGEERGGGARGIVNIARVGDCRFYPSRRRSLAQLCPRRHLPTPLLFRVLT